METLRSIQACMREWNDADADWNARLPVHYELDAATLAAAEGSATAREQEYFEDEEDTMRVMQLFSDQAADESAEFNTRASESAARSASAAAAHARHHAPMRHHARIGPAARAVTGNARFQSGGGMINNNSSSRQLTNSARRRRILSNAEAVARAKHASAVASGSPLLRRLARERRRQEQRAALHQRLAEFERDSQRAAERNEVIRRGFSRHAAELEQARLVDVHSGVTADTMGGARAAAAAADRGSVEVFGGGSGDDEAEALRLGLEREKRKFMERMSRELGPHEDRLAEWKMDLVKQMEAETAQSQGRLVESRVAYEREKAMLELLSKRRAEVMVAEAYERQEAVARGLSRADLAKQEEVLLRSIDACSKEAIQDIVAHHFSTQEERDSRFMHRCLTDIEELRRELKKSTMTYVESLQRRS